MPGFVFDAQEACARGAIPMLTVKMWADPLATRPLVTVGTPVKRKSGMSFEQGMRGWRRWNIRDV